MQFYTLGRNFLRDDVIDAFESAIWTERWIPAGDFELVLPASKARIASLKEGNFLGLQGSDEVMIIETQTIEDGMIKVVGRTLETFFNERVVMTSGEPGKDAWYLRGPPGDIVSVLVNAMCITDEFADDLIGLGGLLNRMNGLELGLRDMSGPVVTIKFPYGPMYDQMLQVATDYKFGMRMRVLDADAFSYQLAFDTYQGLDRTKTQTTNDRVEFSESTDSMAGVKELHSVVGYKTMAYAYPPAEYAQYLDRRIPGIAYQPGTDPYANDFDRRVLLLFPQIDAGMLATATLDELLTQFARDGLANNNYTKMYDGEVVPQADFQYGVHFGLGDKVDLVGQTGSQQARITEFIRTQDATGERAYPTVSVVN